MKSWILSLSLLPTLFLPGYYATHTTPTPESVASISPLQDNDGRNFCTIWSINEAKRYFVTAAHCVVAPPADAEDDNQSAGTDEWQPLIRYNYQMGEFPTPHIGGAEAKVVWSDVKLDLAVLEAAPGNGAPALRLSPHGPDPDDPITVDGHPWGMPYRVPFYGVYSFRNMPVDEGHYALFDCTAAPGNSGSPVLGRRGVISVLQVGWRSGRLTGGVPYPTLVDALAGYSQ